METETTVSTIKLMNQDLVWLDRFDGSNFTRWQDKLHFLLTALKIIYILDPYLSQLLEPTDEDNDEVKAARKQREDELICRGHILNALSDGLYDLFTNTKSAKEIWTTLEFKYKTEEEDTKKFLISKYFDFKFLDDKPLLPQIYELQIIVNKLKAVKIELPEPFQVGAIIAKLPSTWKDKSEKTNFGPFRARVNDVNKSNHYKSNNQKRGNSQKGNFLGLKKDQEKIKNNNKGDYFVCGKPGHFARDCGFRKKQNEGKVNAIEDEIITIVSEINAIQGNIQGWWYDTCATVHISYDRSFFKTFDELGSTQEMGNENRSLLLVKKALISYSLLEKRLL
ncbi:hypothetical protein UlMin_017101 [Ulmus minor]